MSFGTICSIQTVWEQPEYQVEEEGENTGTMDICQLANSLSHFLSSQFAEKTNFLSLHEAVLHGSRNLKAIETEKQQGCLVTLHKILDIKGSRVFLLFPLNKM